MKQEVTPDLVRDIFTLKNNMDRVGVSVRFLENRFVLSHEIVSIVDGKVCKNTFNYGTDSYDAVVGYTHALLSLK